MSRVFHDVVTDGYDNVGFREFAVHVVEDLKSDGAVGKRMSVDNDPLAMKVVPTGMFNFSAKRGRE